MSECHCGKDGHPLGSMNCPVHGYEPVPAGALRRLLDALDDARDFVDPDTSPPPFDNRELMRRIDAALERYDRRKQTGTKGGPTEDDPDRPYCKPDQSCCDFCCGN
jgi:hypothetical protein